MRLRDTARSRLSLPPESLAEELSSAAANYGSIVWTLTSGPWTGPSSRSIAAAAPYMDLGGVLPASRRSRPPPSHSGGQRVRNRLRRNSSAAVDRRQPEPAGNTRRYEYPGAERSGDRYNGGLRRRDVGPTTPPSCTATPAPRPTASQVTPNRLGRSSAVGKPSGCDAVRRHGAIPAAQACAHSGIPSMMPVAKTAGREGSGLSSIPP